MSRKMNEHASAQLTVFGPRIRNLQTSAYTFAKVRALHGGVTESDAMNDALGVMCALASTAILSAMEQLMMLQPIMNPKDAYDVIAPDIAARVIKAANAAIDARQAEIATADAKLNGVANDG